MHYKVDYSLLSDDPVLCRESAVRDIKEFWGEKRFDRIVGEFKKCAPMELEKFELLISFAGVSGYPVKALHETIWPVQH